MPLSSLKLDLMPINIVIYKKTDDDFVFVAFNKMAQKTENISLENVIGKKLTKVFPNAKKYGFFDFFKRVYDTGKSEILDTKYYKDDRFFGWRRNEAVKLPTGEIAVFYSDVGLETKLKENELKLEKQLSKADKILEKQKDIFQFIMENSDALSVQGYDENHKVVYWNKASEKLYGYSKEEAIGRYLEDLIIPDFMRQAVHDGIDNWIKSNMALPSSELTLVDKYGNDTFVYSQHIMINIDSTHKEMFCIDIDLKEIKILQHELEAQKIFLKSVINVIPDLIWLKDLNGNYMICNKEFEKFFGAKESEIIGKNDFNFLNDEQANFFTKNDKLTIKTNALRTYIEKLEFKDTGYKGVFETIKTPLKNTSGNTIGVLGISRDISERIQRETELETYALYDTLTKIYNRTNFLGYLKTVLKQRKHNEDINALFFMDLDHFKEINDTKGHAMGDKVLVEVANRLAVITREEDMLARFGGDEFTLLIKNAKDIYVIKKIAQNILDTIKKPIVINHDKFFVTMSIGIALSPDDTTDDIKLLSYADSAMYKAKGSGRNSYEFYTKEMSKKAFERVILENSLREAIKDQQFEMFYQPQVNIKTHRIIGAEALIRWIHPVMGVVSPAKFIPIAEDSGQIIEIGKWVIYQSMKDMCKLKKDGIDINTMSINLSAKQLEHKDLIQTIKNALLETNCDPRWIEFEVTETYAMSNPKNAIILLQNIKELNCKLSIDDFGTGYSSLQYLKQFPVDKLKIDQSFMNDIPGDSNDEAIVKAVILIAKSMKLEVIAEGVEHKSQQDFLLKNGCNLIQGFYHSKPVPFQDFCRFITSKSI